MKPLEPGMRYAPRVPASPRLVDREAVPAAAAAAAAPAVGVLTSPLEGLPAQLDRLEAKLAALMAWVQAAELTLVRSESKLDALMAWIQAAEITSVEVKPCAIPGS